MEIIPAIDIVNGQCVRLKQGDPRKIKIYYTDPIDAAKAFISQGIKKLHVVDIDAALGRKSNSSLISKLVQRLPVEIQLAGGIRNLRKTKACFKIGASKIVFGTTALEKPALVKKAIARYGQSRIAVAIDEKGDKIALNGWKKNTEKYYLDFAQEQERNGVGTIIFTSIGKDGTLEGPDFMRIEKLVDRVNIPVIASGGVGKVSDLYKLHKVGVHGVIIGTAFYEGRFSIQQALEASLDVN